jgi:hypothetical protein
VTAYGLVRRARWYLMDLIARIPARALVWAGICPYCFRHTMSIACRPTRTMYYEPDRNYEVSCVDCYEEHDEVWRDMWQEYYAGCR